MGTTQILVGVLVGWASSACWRSAGLGNAWLNRLVGAIGGIVGAWLALTFGSGDPIPTAIWAWAGAIVISDIVAMTAGGGGQG